MSYQQKYLKYKNKYLNFKNMHGGGGPSYIKLALESIRAAKNDLKHIEDKINLAETHIDNIYKSQGLHEDLDYSESEEYKTMTSMLEMQLQGRSDDAIRKYIDTVFPILTSDQRIRALKMWNAYARYDQTNRSYKIMNKILEDMFPDSIVIQDHMLSHLTRMDKQEQGRTRKMLERYANKFFPKIKPDTIIDEYISQHTDPSSKQGLSYEGLHLILSQQPPLTQPTLTPPNLKTPTLTQSTKTQTTKSPQDLSDFEMTKNHRTMDELVEFVKARYDMDDITALRQINIALETGPGNLPLDPSELTFKRVDPHMRSYRHLNPK